MNSGFWIGFGMIVGYLVLLHWGIRRMLAEEKARSRQPFPEKLKRPPGESLRIKVEQLRDEVGETALKLSLSVMWPAMFIMLLRVRPPALEWTVNGLLLSVSVSASALNWCTLRRLRKELRNARLGYDGERYVAEELNGLMARGYRVFHDFQVDWFPGEKVFNIDHIAVGPEGIFAIETKTRRKRNIEGRDDTHVVEFDGTALKYPGDIPRTDAIQQARANARVLSKWLTGTAAETVEVRPLVVTPGWYVKASDWKTCGVQTAKGLAARLPGLGRGRPLSAGEIQRIGDRIEAHCRNIEAA